MNLKQHPEFPLISEWCVTCRAYTEHLNGFTRSMNACAFMCLRCRRTTKP